MRRKKQQDESGEKRSENNRSEKERAEKRKRERERRRCWLGVFAHLRTSETEKASMSRGYCADGCPADKYRHRKNDKFKKYKKKIKDHVSPRSVSKEMFIWTV